jgi:hypothetical protein
MLADLYSESLYDLQHYDVPDRPVSGIIILHMGDAPPLLSGYASGQDVTLDHLEDQIVWYDRISARNQKAFKFLKICTISAAAVIPVLAKITTMSWVTAGLGVFIVILEGLQQLNQYHSNWISYRSTCEALKHEKFLYLGKAGMYAAANDPHSLLAERIESLISQEHAKWASSQEQRQKVGPPSVSQD